MQTQDDEIDLLEIIQILWDERRILVGTTAAVAVFTIIMSLLMTPIYRAEVVVMEVDSTNQAGGTAAALLGQFGGLAGLANVDLYTPTIGRMTLRSRTLLEEFIRRNDLMSVIFEDSWDKVRQAWSEDLEREPTLADGAVYFRDSAYSVTTNPDNGTITLAVEWTDPALTARWANALVALANELIRERDIAEARSNIAYLHEQIAATNVVELQRVLYGLLESEQKTIMLASSRDEYSFKVIDPAIVPNQKVRPARTLMVIVGTFIGGFLGLMIVLMRRIVAKMRRDTEAKAA